MKGVQTGRRPRTKRTSWVGARPQHALRASLTTMTTTTLLVLLLPLRTLHATLYATRTAIMCSSSLPYRMACASARRRTSAAAAQQQKHPPHPTLTPLSLTPSPAALHCRYGELFEALSKSQLLPLGLYRRRKDRHDQAVEFVSTNPDKGTVLGIGDRVYVLGALGGDGAGS